MMLYQKFRNSSLDLSSLGLRTGPAVSESVYTPAGARILAWVGETDVHFCQVEGLGGMVFVVNPAATPGDSVHPVARSLVDFIGLLCACRHVSVIQDAYCASRSLFEKRLGDFRSNYRAKCVLTALQNTYRPTAIPDPYAYITQVENSFDYNLLPLHADYYEWCPIRPGGLRWNVGYGTGFSEHCERDKAGQELAVGRSFQWAGETWTVPAIYLCENGIVVDSYLQVSNEDMAQFHEKWDCRDSELMSIEDQMYRSLDDPLTMEAIGELYVNGRSAPLKKRFFLRWDPHQENSWQARRALEHYGLDRDKGYLLRRECFLRRGKNPPICAMELKLSAIPVDVPGQRFIAPRSGESLSFTNPSDGREYRLTVIGQIREALDPNFLSNRPCCYTRLAYSLDPPIEKERFSIVDCDPGDPFEQPTDEPPASMLVGKIPSAGHIAVSSLRHIPAETISWRMIFRQKLREDISVSILP